MSRAASEGPLPPFAAAPGVVCGVSLWLATVGAGCQEGKPTALRLQLLQDPDWQLTSLHVDVHDRGRDADVVEELRVLVPDDWAGTQIRVSVAGFRLDQRWAFGAAVAVPELQREVEVTVALSRLPCGAWCTDGDTRCVGSGVSACEQRDEDDCLEWSEPVPCPTELPECALGMCMAECFDECAPGESRCAGPSAVERCGSADADDCLEWQSPLPCEADMVCSLGRCRDACLDECGPGEERCMGGGVSPCVDANADGCLEWGPPAPCPAGTTCSLGDCTAACADECTTATCAGLVYSVCGNYDLDICREPSPGLSCEPVDPCFEGACSPTEGCSSAPLVCDDPPEPVCVDGDTLSVCDAVGACVGGVCDYGCREVDCPGCPDCNPCASVTCDDPPEPVACYQVPGTCSDGSCDYEYADGEDCNDGDACTDEDTCDRGTCAGTEVVCDDPPDPECQGTTTLRTWTGPGACAGGDCDYPHTDTPCDPEETCTAGACVCDGSWTTTTVDSAGDVGTWTSLAVDSAGGVHIAYCDETSGAVKHAYRASGGSSWTRTSLDTGGDFCQFASIAVDAAGGVHIGYRDVDNLDVKYAYRPPAGTFAVSAVDTDGTVGQGTALALDSDGGVHMSYWDETDGLKHAYRDGPSGIWFHTLVAVGGYYTEIATDSANGVHICFYEGGQEKHAYQPSGGAWSISTVGPAAVSARCAITTDSDRGAHVSYPGGTYYRFDYGYRPAGGGWTTSTVDSSVHLTDPSIAVDGAGEVHITFYDDTDLQHAHRSTEGVWAVEVIDSEGDVGEDSSLAVDAEGGLHVSYRDDTNGDLKYAYRPACP